jgi:hypothetical protein
LREQRLDWGLEHDGGELLAGGQLPPFDAESGEVKIIDSTELKMPALEKPAKLRLVAELPGAGVSNSWDLWVFPRPTLAPDAGKAISASPRLYRLLKDRYPGLVKVADAAGPAPELMLAEHFDAAATNALARGKTVLLLSLPGPQPGIALGWWAISKQAGTAIARHPAFGDFPHDGYLNELLFRLVDHTVSPSDEALHHVEPLMVGRGSAGYLLHVFQARASQGKLLASGLKLLAPEPEAEFLLDQFIHYARSPAFQPKGVLDLDAPVPSLAALSDQ